MGLISHKIKISYVTTFYEYRVKHNKINKVIIES